MGADERKGTVPQAKVLLTPGLKECSASGMLWGMAIRAEPHVK